MSAVELIKLFEKLPIEEQVQVRAYFDRKESMANPDGVRRMDLNKAIKIGEGMFDRHPELFRKLSQ